MEEIIKVGFIGAGGIAKPHVYALKNLPYYYDQVPEIQLEAVTSFREESRISFARKNGFKQAQDFDSFIKNEEINTVFILGPNKVHFEHLEAALSMPSVNQIYLEKPVCASQEEEVAIVELMKNVDGKKIQIGHQFLQNSAIRAALKFWNSGVLGKPIHFDLKYYHGDYLQKSYRDKRANRLTPAPEGGAMADLGSHGISLLIAFLGEQLQITSAVQGGSFPDVPESSDLFSALSLFDPKSKAVGHMSASRISAGTGDLVDFEIFCEKGALKYSSHSPDYFEYFLEETQIWSKQFLGNSYAPITSFPSKHVPSGWLRALVHAHYLFLTEDDPKAFRPDIQHGLAVQKLVRETAEYLDKFRSGVS
ncbi:Gfo/Idh/MocA family protein [Flexithrix dorotheae]|uniref:Gfo/Idh/MocA family protein n=1 Tax=Flexithrix dorotheae TaxID=70993 RepID=UPI0003684E2D|nr:Gfo/Idh/MocA family oxidoreductase [Flexithrix dorotheae]